MTDSAGYKVFQAEPMSLLHQHIVIPMVQYLDDTSSIVYTNTYAPPSIETSNSDTESNNDANTLSSTKENVEGKHSSSPVDTSSHQTSTTKVLRDGVAIYEHTNYGGKVVYVYEPGDFSLKQFKKMGLKNDDISSIHVAPGWSIELFEHHNFQGRSKLFTQDVANLIKHKWNDRASSLKVRQVGVLIPKPIPSSIWSIVYEQKKDAVVSLLCKKSDGFYVGSAFFVSHNGYLVTAAHNVVETSANDRPDVLVATVSNINDTGITQAVVCDVIGLDGNGDVAVLKARNVYNQTYFHWGVSRNTPIGSEICTFGDPKGQDFQSFTAGHVRDNQYVYKGTIESIAIDAQIYEGCSGSPIVDVHGQVVGIICFGIQNGDGFSWGMSQYTLEYVVNKIIRSKTNYNKGILDVVWRPVDAFFLHRIQMLHLEVVGIYCLTNSASSELQKDDIILSIDGNQVQGSNAMSILWRKQPNDVINIKYMRPGSDALRSTSCVLKSFTPHEDVVQLGFVQATKYLIQPKKMEIEKIV